MIDPSEARELLACLQAAMEEIAVYAGRTRAGVAEIAARAEQVRAGVETLCAVWGGVAQGSPGVDMLFDTAVDLQRAMATLDPLVQDARHELEALELAMATEDDAADADEETGGEA